jgi:hypothetical protein
VQINAGTMKDDPNVPFTMTKVVDFRAPWRIVLLPDGRMLGKSGPVWPVTQTGVKTPVDNVPAVLFPIDSQAQGGRVEGPNLAPADVERRSSQSAGSRICARRPAMGGRARTARR